jgi:lipopolysaccharide transport system ATP-binding protein
MSEVIKVENLYKQYRLGQVSTGSIAHDLNRWWHTVRGKEDPYEKITGLNNRDEEDNNEYVWALQDINFSVKQGEVLGIIGRNGAGKSTLLKILSKVTSPTKGNIKVKGRIASLLEVGTGFHPELTGRENIFLNGAILGMTKSEIRSKFDEIVAFSGVEKYIDTPVKRYSSGMYVRLAFAVAAHLEPEILIVDEVLAVGDAEFQKKCLGKMKDVSGEGRTVLFVSHNMGAIEDLCSHAMYLEQGVVKKIDITRLTVNEYLNSYFDKSNDSMNLENVKRIGNGIITFTSWKIQNIEKQEITRITCGQDFEVVLNFKVNYPQKIDTLHFSITISDDRENVITHLSNSVANGIEFKISETCENGYAICRISNFSLQPGLYVLHFFCSDLREVYDEISFAGKLEVESGNFFNSGKIPPKGLVLLKNNWLIEK